MIKTLSLCALLLIASAAAALDFPGPDPGPAVAKVEGNRVRLENRLLSVAWDFSAGALPKVSASENGRADIAGAPTMLFAVLLADGRRLHAGNLKMVSPPLRETRTSSPQASGSGVRYGGQRIAVGFADEGGNLQARWQVELRDGSNYLRQTLTLQALQQEIPLKTVAVLDWPQAGPRIEGAVAGSPVVAGNWFYACEHPAATNALHPAPDARAGDTGSSSTTVNCALPVNRILKPGQALVCSSVVGVAPPGQMRRAFLHYIERERPRPYKPFLHYNSWYDIAWGDRKMNEGQCLAVIEAFGRELTEKRGVRLDALVFDDGWDDNRTLWGFHGGFPRGFTPLRAAAEKYGSRVGVWLSPWGGYGQAKEERMKYGQTQGFETNRNGFSLAGPKYYGRFRQVCAQMIEQYDVNYFKFDGVGAGNDMTGPGPEYLADIDGLLRLCQDLRRLRGDVYLSITTGTWPSPFWLFYGDSIWRNGDDCGFFGKGTMRQQWITYRDMITHKMIVRRAPLYPLNSLMVQGICYAQLGTATRMQNDLKDVVDEIRMLFASGTQLQELYVTPRMMTPAIWDVLAEAAAWSRQNADVLVDVHWIGGDAEKLEPYGYASWSPRKGILALRNPDEKPVRLAIDLQAAFELPQGAARRYTLSTPWKQGGGPPLTLEAGRPHVFSLPPFESLVLEADAVK